MDATKVCTTCGESKPVAHFRKQTKNKDGLKYTCIPCDDARAKARYALKKDHIKAKVREWQQKNPDRVKAYRDKDKPV